MVAVVVLSNSPVSKRSAAFVSFPTTTLSQTKVDYQALEPVRRCHPPDRGVLIRRSPFLLSLSLKSELFIVRPYQMNRRNALGKPAGVRALCSLCYTSLSDPPPLSSINLRQQHILRTGVPVLGVLILLLRNLQAHNAHVIILFLL